MSASRERKKRQELLASGGTDPKAAREAAQKAAERRSNMLYGTIGILFLLITAGLLLYQYVYTPHVANTRRNTTAVTIGERTYTAGDVSFYYYDSMLQMSQLVGDLSALGVDTGSPLSEQIVGGSTEDGEEPQTWDDYFKGAAVNTMRYVTAMNAAAQAEGYVLSEEGETVFESTVSGMKSQAAASGVSYEGYLKSLYGSLMTEACFETNLREQLTANYFAQEHEDGLTYTDEDLLARYEENPQEFDAVSYELVTLDGQAESTEDGDGNTVEPTEEEEAAALEAAKEAAQAILDGYEAGGDLEELAGEYEDIADYTTSDEAYYSDGVTYLEWCFEDGRADGDCTITENTASQRIYVVVFHSRFQSERPGISDVRHILINADSVDDAEGSEVSDEEIKARAQEILDSWDGTEDGFIQLVEEYSQDTASVPDGGLIADITSGSNLVQEFKDWALEAGRQPGDTGIVSSTYGYHIMYYKDGTPMWKYDVESTLLREDMTAWEEELQEPYEAVTNQEGMDYCTR